MQDIFSQLAQLECDNPSCTHKVPEGLLVWGKDVIGYDCPECGWDMCTEEDFDIADKYGSTVSDILSVPIPDTIEDGQMTFNGVTFTFKVRDGVAHYTLIKDDPTD